LSFSFGYSQDKGSFTGGFTANGNVFIRDSLIGAADIPQYDNELFGSEIWFNLNYRRSGYDLRIRFDAFNNSNLFNPNGTYTDEGIGYWYIGKQMDKLGIAVGHIYDQIGSGIIYRAYEQRPQLIDNALVGAQISYDFNDNWTARAFTGRQRFLFGRNPGEIKGVAIEGFKNMMDSTSTKTFTLAPGFGFVNRSHDDSTIDKLVDIVKSYIPAEQVSPQFNTYAGSVYNTLTYNKISLYTEIAVKSSEVFSDPTAIRTSVTGGTSFGRVIKEMGSVLYGSLSYADKGLGITLEAKHTEFFDFRTDPTLAQNFGLINFIPPMNRFNTYRLTSRYSPATQLLSEQAYQLDIRYSPNRKLGFNVNGSYIDDLAGNLLYREIFTEISYKKKRLWQIIAGVQLQQYNQEIYEVKPEAPIVETLTPYVDFLYRFTRKKSIRVEAQYMSTEQDFGSWVFGLAEVGLAPHWIFEVSGMYNISPGKSSPIDVETGDSLKLLYPTLGVTFIQKSNRFSARYVKQVEGVVCSGGVCRLEPAFSGVRMSMSSTF
jgi:hypothetical protein